MEYVLETLRSDWRAFLEFSPKLLYAMVLLSLFLVAANALGKLAARVVSRSDRLQPNERFIRRLVTWAVRLAGVLLALGIMGFEGVAASLLATGGVVAIVLGFAFREVGENLLAGLFLAFSRPFEHGDLIQTGDLQGTVRAIDIRSVHIRTADACDVFVPSAQIFRQPLYNYTRDGLRRPGFTVGVAYHDEPERVIGLLQNAAAGDDVLGDPAVVVSVQAFEAGFVVYEVFFWMDLNQSERGIVEVANDVKIRCWRALRDAGMTFSTDVSTALEIRSLPALSISGDRA